jgi:hypothetical protein
MWVGNYGDKEGTFPALIESWETRGMTMRIILLVMINQYADITIN